MNIPTTKQPTIVDEKPQDMSILHHHVSQDPRYFEEYPRCTKCRNYVHYDLMANIDFCMRCFTRTEQEYECFECELIFNHTGMPIICPHCGSLDVHSDWSAVEGIMKQSKLSKGKN